MSDHKKLAQKLMRMAREVEGMTWADRMHIGEAIAALTSAPAEPRNIEAGWRDPATGDVWSEADVRFEGKNTLGWERVAVYARPAAPAEPEPLLLQDENSGREGRRYNEWHATRPDARLNAREAAGAIDAREQSPDDELLVACITLDGTTLTVEANALADMFGTDDEQHTYGLTFKRMTRAAYEALGEFNGF